MFRKILDSVSGVSTKRASALSIIAKHEGSDNFDPDSLFAELGRVLGEKDAKRFYVEHVTQKVNDLIREVLEDGLLDDTEQDRINATLEKYGNPQLGQEAHALLASARNKYEALTRPLAPVQPTALLKRGEECFLSLEASAAEERTRTTRINYGGPTARIKIVKGVYYSMGSIGVSSQEEAYLHSFRDGRLEATNKRILWISPAKTLNIPLAKIVQFELFNDGMKIYKETGKPLIFEWQNDGGECSIIMGRVIEELR